MSYEAHTVYGIAAVTENGDYVGTCMCGWQTDWHRNYLRAQDMLQRHIESATQER